MATGPEHYKAAEKDIEAAGGSLTGGGQFFLARAQVHATLAAAAASALYDDEGEQVELDAWREVAGAPR